jgi:Zn-dependent protease with chaperone function
VYLSGTDVIFISLILLAVIVPVFWVLFIGFTIFSVEVGESISLLIVLYSVVFTAIPALIYWHYKRSVRKNLEEAHLKPFQESMSPEYYRVIQGFYANLPHTFEPPALMCSPDLDCSASAFGTRKRSYIQLSTGLIATEEPNTFKSIFLHELGHLENRDLTKTSLAVSVMSAMKVLLPAILALFVVYFIYHNLSLLYYGLAIGLKTDTILPTIDFGTSYNEIGTIALYFFITGVLIYLFRNQIIRSREFYADAKAAEWLKSTAPIEQTLEKFREQKSKGISLKRYHPSNKERIQLLRDNSKLFSINSWIILSVGLLSGFLSANLTSLATVIVYHAHLPADSWVYFAIVNGLAVVVSACISALIISIEFHRLMLKEWLFNKKFFSTKVLLTILKVAVVFSAGFTLSYLIIETQFLNSYSDQLFTWAIRLLENSATFFYSQIIHLVVVLLFLWVFGLLLVKRSFSKKAARRNFWAVSAATALFYLLTNSGIGLGLFVDYVWWVLFIVCFIVAFLLIIHIHDRRVRCPQCMGKLKLSSDLRCAHCGNQLYSWGVYDF